MATDMRVCKTRWGVGDFFFFYRTVRYRVLLADGATCCGTFFCFCFFSFDRHDLIV